MSKINFLIKLKNQGKLELVEPSEELKEAYLRKLSEFCKNFIDFHITREDTNRLIKIAEEFNTKIIDYIQKLNNEDILRYREKIKKEIRS